MGFDGFVRDARERIAGEINLMSPDLVETMLCRAIQPDDVEPVHIELIGGVWSMLAYTALPDGRIYRVEYSCRTDAWMITAYRREAPKK